MRRLEVREVRARKLAQFALIGALDRLELRQQLLRFV